MAPLARWLLAVRENGRWRTTHENGMALEALVSYYRAMEPDVPRHDGDRDAREQAHRHRGVQGTIDHGPGNQDGDGAICRQPERAIVGPDHLATGTGRLFYTTRLQTLRPQPVEALDRGIPRRAPLRALREWRCRAGVHVVRARRRGARDGHGHRAEGVALPRAARRGGRRVRADRGLVPDDGQRPGARVNGAGRDRRHVVRLHGAAAAFDHIEKHDDRVLAFATRLGRAATSSPYLVRATTAGTFHVAGARVEAMYAPELTGRSQAATVTVK